MSHVFFRKPAESNFSLTMKKKFTYTLKVASLRSSKISLNGIKTQRIITIFLILTEPVLLTYFAADKVSWSSSCGTIYTKKKCNVDMDCFSQNVTSRKELTSTE